jgi:elongation factor G
VDTALEMDDDAMEKYLTDDDPPAADVLRKCIRKGTDHERVQPGACGSSYKNKGVQQVLDAVGRLHAGPDGRRGHQDGGRGR